jgi:hypothetical protein
MLGQFLELALVTAEAGAAWQNYQKLGFEPAATGDIWTHDYGVVAAAGLAIGLHARGDEPMSLVFVRPEVATLHRQLAAGGIEVEQARLGSDVFNELVLREPGGIALRVLEARTFSPPLQLPVRTALGRFHSLSLPCRDIAATQEFWQALGLDCTDVAVPWEGLAVSGTPLACHRRRDFAEPVLVFQDAVAPEAGVFAAAGILARPSPASLRDLPHVFGRTAEDQALLIVRV